MGDAVTQGSGKVSCGGGVGSALVCGVQAVWCYVVSVKAADIPGFCIHHFCKTFYGAPHMLCDGYGGIVVGFQHKGVKKISQAVLLSFSNSQLDIRHTCSILGYGDDFV